MLGAISTRRPTLLVVDDLQWADASSLLLLRRLARFPHRGRFLICATYRSGPSGALAETLAELGRERLVERVAIGGLSRDEVAALVASIRGAAIDPGVADAVWEETGGNPFLVEALGRPHGGDRRQRAPGPRRPLGSRRALPGRRPAARPRGGHAPGRHARPARGSARSRLRPSCGSDFSADFVNEVADLPPEDVIAALEAAVGAAVLVDVPGSLDRYAFAHALLRQAIYTGIPKTRRASLHRRVAENLEKRHGNDPRHVAELASHFAAGGADRRPAGPRVLRQGRRQRPRRPRVRRGARALRARPGGPRPHRLRRRVAAL